MTKREAEKLKIGDKVTWTGDVNDSGIVVDKGYAAVTRAWDNGQTGTVDLRDMEAIGKA